ncbi:hypothetical protein [Planctomicrobium piriforme]|uniref:Uncharacterized protein n=1 Tax=Planctomicrobium piriforme TaxID=1576369 RepID=A0A1I3SLK5_9PLAN|nr:hypothetical protein [Planctomicrobium piriforme]SFJ58559.1 hypothetical protein SAMN05421753_12448 [Planctomicrobium piriforme]
MRENRQQEGNGAMVTAIMGVSFYAFVVYIGPLLYVAGNHIWEYWAWLHGASAAELRLHVITILGAGTIYLVLMSPVLFVVWHGWLSHRRAKRQNRKPG